MRVLSLFDGIACGYEALQRAGIPIDAYFASEIDKYAIQIAKKNHPDIIELGDINEWGKWDIPTPDIIIGGSPCQGFSMAGKMLNFDDPRSKLFFKFVDIVNHYHPKYFLLENVKMKKEFQDVISEYMGVEPIEIDSSLVSAQNRRRLYRTNIPSITQPKDKGILLKDILEENVDSKYYLTERQISLIKPQTPSESGTAKRIGGMYGQITRRGVYDTEGQAPTITASMGMGGGHIPMIPKEGGIRKLTPIECERLQTLPDNYTAGVSNTQRYKALGNGRTVDVIAHIFSYIPK